MENPRDLETQAHAITHDAKALLTKPDYHAIFLESQILYGPNYILKFRAMNEIDASGAVKNQHRFLDLEKIYNDTSTTTLFSQNLDTAEQTNAFDRQILNKLLTISQGVPPEVADLLLTAIKMKQGREIPKEEIDKLYAPLIREAKMWKKIKKLTRNLKDDSVVSITENALANPDILHDPEEPVLTIKLAQKARALEFCKLMDGSFETAEKDVDTLDQIKELSVDDSGTIQIHESSTRKPISKEAIAKSRTAGLRKLRGNLLDEVQKAVAEMAKQ